MWKKSLLIILYFIAPRQEFYGSYCFALFGVMWALTYLVRDILLGWYGSFMGKKHRKVWMAAPLCLFWAVWKERNRIAFENEELSIHRMKKIFVCNFWS